MTSTEKGVFDSPVTTGDFTVVAFFGSQAEVLDYMSLGDITIDASNYIRVRLRDDLLNIRANVAGTLTIVTAFTTSPMYFDPSALNLSMIAYGRESNRGFVSWNGTRTLLPSGTVINQNFTSAEISLGIVSDGSAKFLPVSVTVFGSALSDANLALILNSGEGTFL